MKRFSRILFYLRSQKRNIILYLFFNILSIIFSLVSLAMLAPFLQMLFGKEKFNDVRPEWHFTATGVLDSLKYMIGNLIQNQFGASRNWPFGAALAFALLAFVLIAMTIYAMRFNRTLEAR